MTLSPKTLRLMTTLSNRDKMRAEAEAAQAARRVSTLDGQSATLTAYMTELGARLAGGGIATGIELKACGQFLELGIRARNRNAEALEASEVAQQTALDALAVATEKHKSLRKATDAADAVALTEAERKADRAR